MLSFLPNYIFPAITDVSETFLRERNIRLLLLDFDNTMLPYTKNEPSRELLQWIEHMRAADVTLCIVSNSHKPRVTDFSKRYGVPCVTGAKKPRGKGIREALRRFDVPVAQTALIGDQIYTDVLGANLAGACSIIVRSIHNHNFWLKLRHAFEVPFLVIARKRRVKL